MVTLIISILALTLASISLGYILYLRNEIKRLSENKVEKVVKEIKQEYQDLVSKYSPF